MNSNETATVILSELRTRLSAELNRVMETQGGNRQTEETRRAGRRSHRKPGHKRVVSGKEATRSLDRLLELSGDQKARQFVDNCKIFSRRTLSACLYLLREHSMEGGQGKIAVTINV